MRWRTFIVGYAFSLALLLLIQHRPGLAQGGDHTVPTYRKVVDLTLSAEPTHNRSASMVSAALRNTAGKDRNQFVGTRIESPALYSPRLWNAAQIPAERLVAPLVVMDVRNKVALNPNYQIGIEDIAEWERTHGAIPPNSVIAAETNWQNPRILLKNERIQSPGFSMDAVKFLVQAREVVALGSDARGIATGEQKSAVDNFTLAHSVYHVENLTNLDSVPPTGSIVMIAPGKSANASVAPVRVLAIVR
jgi:kynurenine formamidase